ncbi:MAG TPA: hypothetical protein VGD94_02370 [Vicinamibacterales bacterium]
MLLNVRPALTGLLRNALCVIVVSVLVASCGGSVDIKESVQVTDVSTGWFDAGVVDGKNKLVPSVTFRLRNTSNQDLSAVSINVAFKFIDNGDDLEEIFKQRVPFENKQTELLTVRAQTGFTGEPPQSRADMLRNSHFRDVEAIIFVRQASAQWVELHRVQVERQLLTN